MAKQNIIIKNACVITGQDEVFADGYVHFCDGLIESVGRSSDVPKISKAKIIDSKGRYVLPGFINPHMHLYSALARGMPVRRMRSFGEILKGLWWPLDRTLTLEDIRVSALLGGIEAIKSGVTTLVDHHASYGTISGSLGVISEALENLGLRASLCFELSDRAGKSKRNEAICESTGFLEEIACRVEKNPNHLQRGMVGLHASMTLSDGTLHAAREIMDAYNVGAHVHVAEGIEDVNITRKISGLSPVARLAKTRILDTGSLAVHCVHASRKDIALLKSSGTYVVHNPMSNLNNAVGIAPFLDMCKRRIPVAIGTDGMSAGIADDVRLASVLHKIKAGDATVAGAQVCNSVWKVAPQIISRMFYQDIGVIRKGAAADIIIIDAMPPTEVTAANAWWHVLFGVLNAPVRTTIIGGSVRMQDFEVVGVDEKDIARQARHIAKKLWNRF